MAKKMSDWLDHLGKSGMPTEEMNFQTGNNFGLDAFQFDVQDNQGPEDGGRLPTTRGLAGLPDGTIPMEVEADFTFADLTDDSMDGLGMDFTAMISEDEGNFDKMASLTDLDWLDPTQAPDLNRLPNNEKTLNSIPYLEEAWGKGRSTNGIELVPNTDKEAAQYRASLQDDPNAHTKTAEELRFALERASRRAHYGEKLHTIQAELVDTLGHDASRTVKAMKVIKDDIGLAGKVFIRASAFPGVKNGKWADKIKAKCAGARYVITDDQTIADKVGMIMVAEVPWKKALSHYAPRLAAAGYKVASVGDPKEVLRRAFQLGPAAVVVNDSPKPVVKPVVASQAEAKAAIAAPRPEAPKVATAEEQAVAAKRRAALVQMARWVKEGKLSQKDAFRINATGAIAGDMLRTASIIMTASDNQAVYDGVGTQVHNQVRLTALSSLEEKTAGVEAALLKKAQAGLSGVVKAGLLTIKEAKAIAKMSRNASELTRNTSAAIEAAGSMRKLRPEAVKVADYNGPIQKAAMHAKVGDVAHLDPYMQRVVNAAAEHNIKAGEITQYLKWTRQAMAEGTMGHELTALIKARYASPLRKAARELFKEVRAKHEGLSGHLYVDAEAYASKTGTTGCEDGALKHRANSIKYVMAMSRCDGCVFANADGVCSQYNKRLASKPPVKDVAKYQAEALRLANADEAEVVASMFNPKDFNLSNAPLDEIHVAGEHTPEVLGELLFGGMDLGE